jgi:beta-glucosidase
VLTPSIAPGQRSRVEIDVTNTGRRRGDEVVQLYVRDDEASVTRPVIELRRFQRVTLAAGERRTIAFDLQPEDLALWNPDMKHVIEPGTFTVYAGPNSVDLKPAKLTVTGSKPWVLQDRSY